jgi:dihydrofolate reductase
MAVFVYVATSLDGFIAAPDGSVDWLMEVPNPDGSDFGFSEFMQGVDALVMGRNTFETVLGFGAWPYDKPVFVLSETLSEVPEHLAGRAEIVQGPLDALLRRLEERGLRNLYVDGGRVIQGFLAEDLVDELIITRVPIVLGEGIPLFGHSARRLRFDHRNTEVLAGTLVKSRYARVRDQEPPD